MKMRKKELETLLALTLGWDLIGSSVLDTWTKQYKYDPIGSIGSLIDLRQRRFRLALFVSIVTLALMMLPASWLLMEQEFAVVTLLLVGVPFMIFVATHIHSTTAKEEAMESSIRLFQDRFEVLSSWYPLSLRNLIYCRGKDAEKIGIIILSNVARQMLQLDEEKIPEFLKRDRQEELKAEFKRKYAILHEFGMASGSWTKYFDAARRSMTEEKANPPMTEARMDQ